MSITTTVRQTPTLGQFQVLSLLTLRLSLLHLQLQVAALQAQRVPGSCGLRTTRIVAIHIKPNSTPRQAQEPRSAPPRLPRRTLSSGRSRPEPTPYTSER